MNIVVGILTFLGVSMPLAAAHFYVIVVPIELQNLDPAVFQGRVSCGITPTSPGTASTIPGGVFGTTSFAIVRGGFHGQVRVRIRTSGVAPGTPVSGDPASPPPFPDGTYYACSITLFYRCASSADVVATGTDAGTCSADPEQHGRQMLTLATEVLSGVPGPAHRIVTSAPGTFPVVQLAEVFDYMRAIRLPRAFF